ncbi:hypothetical protein [Tunturiibacter gelidoferens]|uniref:Uncharacterized protein n=1 Tax=Tunturiibacter lichenicola TaxID=2051959 RepID=A0A7Y9T5D6_9BACT|nr:hypothetical protein [Edaphobacter lichenicola]NYF52229.1 hypothetical protein [Edaphobacter lichenicola]
MAMGSKKGQVKALTEYLYLDKSRIRSYAEQIGATLSSDKRPEWKVGLSLTGPSVEGKQSETVRPTTDPEMVDALVAHLTEHGSLLLSRPKSEEDALAHQPQFVLETMQARQIIFHCEPQSVVTGLRDLVVWVSNPIEKPDVTLSEEKRYRARGMFVYLLVGFWDDEQSTRAYSMNTALNVLLRTLESLGANKGESDGTRRDFASPTAILERAGGFRGEVRTIRTLYTVRAVSENKVVSVEGTTIRCNDLFGYPLFIATA